ncbi:hypothetical protein D0Z07_7939 [Hyphodiscus hymeniophilus]|uniref:Uncharacterized protein n=1 Tax=Hyphodiscus hymeniophilus TaxID=353542 RepID=A0A9P6SKS2_9HELO|nr:hypothetical protein D0Z07_7939 [Hyphodiscus hymeniophilus]
MESITIINKSGKVVSTGKHLLNIFKDAKQAYNEKKAALQTEQHARIKAKTAQKLIQAREETVSVASSRHSRSSHRSHRHKHRDREGREAGSSRPPLTDRNLSHISEGSVASSRRSRSSYHGSRTPRSPIHDRDEYRAPYFENADIEPGIGLVRRHTDFPAQSHHTHTPSYHSHNFNATALAMRTQPPAYSYHRSSSVPDLHVHDEHIDMNLAYGSLPPDLLPQNTEDRDIELAATMSKLDTLLLEAHCLQHSATAIITNLQSNPEAMAAVALTLAELSNLLTKMSPSILTALKASSPAVFALLASPQFLIAGGLAIGVTVVMFGGYKIIKKIQENAEAKKEANRMEEALVYEGDLGSIDIWRRGIAEVEAQSVATSVDGEFITPEAARQKRERIKQRATEERTEGSVHGSVRSERSESTVRRVRSDSTIRRKDASERGTSKVAESETGRSERSASSKSKKGKEIVLKEKKSKKSSAIGVLFKKSREKKEREREATLSLRPKMIEL